MKSLRLILLLTLPVLLYNCTATRPTHPAVTAYGVESPEVITKSLFDSKDRTISEEDIQRILNGKIIIPDTVRVAIFRYPSSSINRYYINESQK